jgi:hypothetical protein
MPIGKRKRDGWRRHCFVREAKELEILRASRRDPSRGKKLIGCLKIASLAEEPRAKVRIALSEEAT